MIIGFLAGVMVGGIIGIIIMALAAINTKEEKQMRIKDAKTIAEYAVRKWMDREGFQDGYFTLKMNGDEGTITDHLGDKLSVRYDRNSHSIEVL